MAMKSKEEQTVNEQVSFDDLMEGLESEYEEERTFLTISGKEYQDVQSWEQYRMYDFEPGEEVDGIPEITHFENKDKKYDSLRVRVLDDGEYADLYINIPKPDKNGFVTNIRKGFDFYRTAFDFIYSVLKFKDEANVIDKNGEEINTFGKVNIIAFAKYVDQMKHIYVKIIEGNENSDYDSWIIYRME